MGVIRKPENTTISHIFNLHELSKKIYDENEIQHYDILESINHHPLAKRPTSLRSKLAYREIMTNLKPTTKYLLPGQLVCFHYANPKYKEELEYYDATPLTLFLGIMRTKDGVIREVGLNLHYYPPFARARILNQAYTAFKPYFNKFFNEPSTKPNTFISYSALKHIMKTNQKLGFGIKMYIPVLRGTSYLVPTRLISTAFYTEGHFAKATLANIYHFWRTF